MKVVFLNACNGIIQESIGAFIRLQALDTEVFCFQEVFDEMGTLLSELLPDYRMVSGHKKAAELDDFAVATYARNELQLLSSQLVLEDLPGTGLGVYTQFTIPNTLIHLCNLHGTARPGNKLDTPERISQTQALLDFFKETAGLKIIGGDFNLLPETKSARMFEEHGYRSLIKDFKIRTTRNRLAWDLYPNNKLYHSDYVFVSPETKILKFSVPVNEISDHLALILSFE